MKIYKIEMIDNDNLRILIKKKKTLIAICIDKDNNIIADCFEDDLEVLNEIAGLQTYMQKIETKLFDKYNCSKDGNNYMIKELGNSKGK